jgi:hypothetical protein
VFAGAAREAVFSNPDVIKRVNADFIPVALKAALVNRPPDDEEGLLYREVARSRIAPQGICVVNSAGKVLNWALMFDDDKGVLTFLDHARDRYAKFPDARRRVAAERHARFPSQRLDDVADSGRTLPVLDRHPRGKHCPAEPPLRRGTVVARLVGRALDKHGKPVAETVRQENYVEDRFPIGVEAQERLAEALADTGKGRVKVPGAFARRCVTHAHLGVLDVQPLDNPVGSQGDLKRCEFWAESVGKAGGPALWRIEGASHVFIDRMANAGPGDMHEVKLTWHGFVEMDGKRLTRLTLAARGAEVLKFGSARPRDDNEVASLPAGHRTDIACAVRYGILGEPAAGSNVTADAAAPAPGAPLQRVPEEARKQLVQALGGPFLIFREKVQDELKLTREAREKLLEKLPDYLQETMRVFEKLQDAKPQEREKAMQAHRRKSEEKLSALLQGLLGAGQRQRLFQLQLQQAGAFALVGEHEAFLKLRITAGQRRQFLDVVHDMHKAMEPSLKALQSGADPAAIMPEVTRIRRDHEGRIEAILNDAQRAHWKKLLGKPLPLDD